MLWYKGWAGMLGLLLGMVGWSVGIMAGQKLGLNLWFCAAISMALAGVLNWRIGAHLNRGGVRHSLFSIPLEGWSIAIFMGAFWCLAQSGAFDFGR